MNRQQINQYFVNNYNPIDEGNIAGFVDFVKAAYISADKNQLIYVEGIDYLLTKMRDNNISDDFLQLLINAIRNFAFELSHSPNVTADNLATVMNNYYEFVNAMISNTDINKRVITQAIRASLGSVVQVFQQGIIFQEGIRGQIMSQEQNTRMQEQNTRMQELYVLINGPTFSPGKVANAVVNIAEQARQQGTNGPIYQRALCDFIRGFNNSMDAQPLNIYGESEEDDDERSQQRENELIEKLRQFFTTTTSVSRYIGAGVLPITDVNFSCTITREGSRGQQDITSPLESAIITRKLRVVQTLFEECQQDGYTRVDPNFRSVLTTQSMLQDNQPPTYGRFPLTVAIRLAIRNRSWDIVMFLLQNGAFAGEEALNAIMRSQNGISQDVWNLFATHYGANRVQEDQELIDQAVQEQHIHPDNSLLEMITQIDARDFVDIPRITDQLGLLEACKKIWTRGSAIFNNWDNYNLYKLLVTYYYAESHNLDKQLYPMRMSNYNPTSFLDNIQAPLFETKRSRDRGREDNNNSSSSSSSSSSFCRDYSNSIECSSLQRLNRQGSLSSSSSGQDGLLSSLAVAEEPSLLSSNYGNQKKSRVSDGPGGNEPGRGPPAAQLQKPPPPDFEDPEACAQYLGFNGGIESIGIISQLHENVRKSLTLAEGNHEWKDDIRKARDTVHGELEAKGISGGKRRTMKVKKHFRKTKKRIYKKVKKTRMRRNNKSKRVLKGKKDKR